MIEVLFSPVNVALTILVIVLVLYWVFSAVTGLDLDFDFDVDFDLDADVSVEAGSGIDVDLADTTTLQVDEKDVIPDRRARLSWWQRALVFFNFAGLPFLFTFTAWILFWWLSSLALTSLWEVYNHNIGFVVMLASAVPGLFISKLITTPFKSFFKQFNKDGDKPISFIGKQGRSLSTISAQKMGNAEVVVNGNPYTIYIKSASGEPISYHDEIEIIKKDTKGNYYYAQTY